MLGLHSRGHRAKHPLGRGLGRCCGRRLVLLWHTRFWGLAAGKEVARALRVAAARAWVASLPQTGGVGGGGNRAARWWDGRGSHRPSNRPARCWRGGSPGQPRAKYTPRVHACALRGRGIEVPSPSTSSARPHNVHANKRCAGGRARNSMPLASEPTRLAAHPTGCSCPLPCWALRLPSACGVGGAAPHLAARRSAGVVADWAAAAPRFAAPLTSPAAAA